MKVFALFVFVSGFASLQDRTPTIGEFGEDLSQKASSLNPQYLLFLPNPVPEEPVPLVIYLHGAGGVGDRVQKLRGQAGQIRKVIEKFKKGPCIIVAPQAAKRAKENGGWVPKDLNLLLGHLKETLKIDEKRIYLTGNSMGGYGSWIWGGNNPEHFAAILPVSGGTGPGGPKDVSPDIDKWAANLATVPVYAFVGGKDRVVPAERSESMITAIQKAGGKDAQIKVYPDEGHGAGRIAFGSAEFYEWMFSKKRD
ncbi:MAG: prolyl oligopeptidase family serine peptidase [Planctomycetota bacterium]|nr:prolyl oligopeptidase family serine peptidase [Planctomycetota bacterium]